jgi:hypothetical protein
VSERSNRLFRERNKLMPDMALRYIFSLSMERMISRLFRWAYRIREPLMTAIMVEIKMA